MNNELSHFAHDVKNTLSIVKLSLEQIQKLAESNVTIYDKAQKAIVQVNSCVTYCDAKILEKRETVLFSKVLIEFKKYFESIFEGLEFRVICFEEIKCSIDKSQFKNFIHNIAKNTYEANARKLSFYVRGDCLVVIDNGSGFPEAVLKESIPYDLNLRGHGLKSMKSFCRLMNWTIELSNSIDESQQTVSGAKITIKIS